MIELHLDQDLTRKIYFASDFHLGTPTPGISRAREAKIIRWLSAIQKDAQAIFLLGDIFDFWYEYSKVIPKGFARFQGKIASLTDSGIPVLFFSGNHDMWMKDYFTEELGVQVFHDPVKLTIGSTKLLIGHGDGLGPGDTQYKLLKKLFKNKVARWAFSRIHPNFALSLGQNWSKNSRLHGSQYETSSFNHNEYLYRYCEKIEQKEHFDYYIFGHRHLHLDMQVGSNSRYINLGEWVNHSRYAVLENSELTLVDFEN